MTKSSATCRIRAWVYGLHLAADYSKINATMPVRLQTNIPPVKTKFVGTRGEIPFGSGWCDETMESSSDVSRNMTREKKTKSVTFFNHFRSHETSIIQWTFLLTPPSSSPSLSFSRTHTHTRTTSSPPQIWTHMQMHAHSQPRTHAHILST